MVQRKSKRYWVIVLSLAAVFAGLAAIVSAALPFGNEETDRFTAFEVGGIFLLLGFATLVIMLLRDRALRK